MLAAAMLALLQCDAERWIRALDDDRIEVRDSARRALTSMGESVLSRLVAARACGDGERRARLDAVLAEFGWSDAARRKALYLDAPALELPGPTARTEGVTFAFEGCRLAGWTLVAIRDYAVIEGEVEWTVAEVVDEAGRAVPFRLRHGVVAARAGGALRVRLRGTRTWLSPMEVTFDDVRREGRKRIGGFTVEVRWPSVRIEAPRDYPESLLTRTCDSVETQEERAAYWVRFAAPGADAFITDVRRSEARSARYHALRFNGAECVFPRRLRLTFHRPVDEPFEVESPLLLPDQALFENSRTEPGGAPRLQMQGATTMRCNGEHR